MRRIILDVDTGIDDALAIILASCSPDLDLVGVTSVRGNNRVAVCTENSLRVLDYLGAGVPVYEGLAMAMVRPEFRHGPSPTHGEYLNLPPARTPKQTTPAVDWLIETLLASEGDITLVAVGPLTNIATAMRREPRILPKIHELVMMGGGHAIANMTASAEFNVYCDPEAAKIVFACGRPMRLVTLDATHEARVNRADVTRLRALDTPAAELAAQLIETYIKAYEQYETGSLVGTAPVHDALAVCAVIDPAVLKTVFVHADVETRGELTDGRTVFDLYHCSASPANVHVALNADGERMGRLFTDILGRREPAHSPSNPAIRSLS